jgi:hypothetical protein
MNDPERFDDTDPTGPPDGMEDPDPGGEDPTIPDAGTFGEPDDPEDDWDIDEFFRWMAPHGISYRRRKELVERPSSAGAEFASYACEARPAPVTGRVRREAKVQIRTHVRLTSRSEASDPDAPTVVNPRCPVAPRRALLLWALAGLLAAILVALGWTLAGQTSAPSATPPARDTLPFPTTPAEPPRGPR